MLNKPDSTTAVVKRVPRKASESRHSGAWKVAFADFVLALLCLFMVMWLMAVRQQQHLQELLRAHGGSLIHEGIGRMAESMGGPRGSLIERNPLPSDGNVLGPRRPSSTYDDPQGRGAPIRLSKTLYESREDMQELGEILARLSEQNGLAGNLQWMVTPFGLRVMLHDTEKAGMFELGSAVPNERFRRLLREIGPLFARIENQMLIVGHTDSLPYADRGPYGMSNWELSSARALAARSNLIAGGMPPRSVLQVVGLADVSPLNAENTTAPENRRIELLILTRQQARNIEAMFGAPDEVMPLIDGVVTSVPKREELAALRDELLPTGR